MKQKLIQLGNKLRQVYHNSLASSEPSTQPNKLMIFLRGFETPLADWIRTDPLGHPLETVLAGELTQLQPFAEDEILVVIPAQDTLLTQAVLPKLSTYRLQQALPYALEEQVLDELELLHFAAGPYLTKNAQETPAKLPVAIIKKTLLEQGLSLLETANLEPHYLTSAIFTVPFTENQWQILLIENQALVRTGLYSGFSSELNNLETLLALKLQEENTEIPAKLVIYHRPQQDCSFHALALPVEKIVLTPEQELTLKAQALLHFPYLNLLQVPYQSTRKLKISHKNKKVWQAAGLTFTVWLGLLFFSKLGSLVILSFEHHRLQNIITKTYEQHFPEARAVIDPKARLTAKLKKALAQNEKSRLFQWLGTLAKTATSIRIQNLSFQNEQLNLEVLASSFASLDEFLLALKSEGIEARQLGATLAGSQVKATVLIEGKST
jgi:general secretion pathway protein L